ncbi:MAG: thrombospondin type 3 repeat-containing protein, partial [Candidatus Zixiibacteriota bacterium]
GDYDHDGDVDDNDLWFLCWYLFSNGFYPGCWEEADVNGDNDINIADLTYLVDYLYWGGDPPPPCDIMRSPLADQFASQGGDADGDGIEDSLDNCPYAFNPDQADSNSNGIGDQCDVDCGNVDGLSGPAGPVDINDMTYFFEWLFEDGPAPAELMAANFGGCAGVNVYDWQVLKDYLFAGPGYPRCWHQVACEPIADSDAISLDHVEGLVGPDTILTDRVITFHLRLRHHSLKNVRAVTNGFRVYSPTGATWDTTLIEVVFNLGQYYDAGAGTKTFGITGSGSDTVGLYGASLFLTGMPSDFDTVTHTISIGPIDRSFSGGVICFDSSWFPPTNEWLWATGYPYQISYPSWDGPHCFTILYCCEPRGDVDHWIGVNVADLTYLVAYLFQGGAEPLCVDQANVDGIIGPGGPHDVADLTYLVAYLFQGGPAPPPCE